MPRVLRHIVIAASLLLPAGQAQSVLDQTTSSNAGGEGTGLYSISVFSGYSTSPYQQGLGQAIPPGIGQLGPDENYGASAVLGWQHRREKGGFAARYSGSYTGLVHYTNGNGYSQSLSLSADRTLSRKWSTRFSAYGQDATLIQFLNQPSAISVTAQAPSDFNDFAAAFGLGSFSTAQAASEILGAPVVQTPINSALLGNKVLSYSGTMGLNYAMARHVSVHLESLASGGQNRTEGQSGPALTNYVLPFTYGADGGVSWIYSPSPRTDLGADLSSNWMHSVLQASYTETATASVGRKMGMHWFFKVYGGATLTRITEQLYGTPRTRQGVGGASLGAKTYAGNFVAKYDRTASNTYGIAGTYTNLAGSWNHQHPGSRLSTFASVAQQQIRDTGFESVSGWQASAGFSVTTSEKTSLSAQYVYFTMAGNYLGTPTKLSVQSIRLSMNWSPGLVAR